MTACVLHAGASVICDHSGTATPAATNSRVSVSGQAVVSQLSCGYNVAPDCQFKLPDGTPYPCTAATWSSGATRVTVGGEALLLQDSQATTVPNGVGLKVTSVQSRVKAA